MPNRKQPKPIPAAQEPKDQKKKKSSDAEVMQRIFVIYGLILRGADHNKVLRYASEKWGVTERQAQTYLSRATENLENALEKDREKILRRHVAMRYDLLYKAGASDEMSLCLEVLKDLGKMQGAYPVEKTKLQVGGTVNTTNLQGDVGKLMKMKIPEAGGLTLLEVVRNAHRKQAK